MSYSLKKIFQIVIKSKLQKNSFIFYDKDKKMLCTTFWCYEAIEEKVKLSELTPSHTPFISSEYYKGIIEDIKNNGFDYTKGYIVTRAYDKNNIITNGNHRYLILKKLFGLNHEVKVLKITKKYNPWLHILFIFLVIKPLKLTYRLIEFIKVLIISLLFLNKKIKNRINWTFKNN